MSWLRRFATWVSRLDESDEDKRCRLGLTFSEWNRLKIEESMREHGCESMAEYDALLDSWKAKFHREFVEDERRREARARELWPKDKPYRSG